MFSFPRLSFLVKTYLIEVVSFRLPSLYFILWFFPLSRFILSFFIVSVVVSRFIIPVLLLL